MTATPQPEASHVVGGVRRYREYGVLYGSAAGRWCVIHQRLDDVWHIVGIFATRYEAQAMLDDMYAAPPRKRAIRQEPSQLDGQLDIYGNEAHG